MTKTKKIEEIKKLLEELQQPRTSRHMFNTESELYNSSWNNYNALCNILLIASRYDESAPTDEDWYSWMDNEDKIEHNNNNVDLPSDVDSEEYDDIVSSFYSNFCQNSISEIKAEIDKIIEIAEDAIYKLKYK
jgi:hypothetical protein